MKLFHPFSKWKYCLLNFKANAIMTFHISLFRPEGPPLPIEQAHPNGQHHRHGPVWVWGGRPQDEGLHQWGAHRNPRMPSGWVWQLWFRHYHWDVAASGWCLWFWCYLWMDWEISVIYNIKGVFIKQLVLLSVQTLCEWEQWLTFYNETK